MKMCRITQRIFCIALISAVLFLAACGAKGIKPETPMDTPEHHNLVGTSLFEKGDFAGAVKEFERAKDLDPGYALAYVGIGLSRGKMNDTKGAFAAMEKADDLAESKDEKISVHVGMIRLHTLSRQEDWLEDAEDEFDDAKGIDPKEPVSYYYMGLADKAAGKHEAAARHFRKVIDLNKGYVEEADIGWEAVQKMERAEPGTAVGARIAALDRITRADVAALFVEELNLEALFRDRNVKVEEKPSPNPSARPTDYDSHVLKNDIDTVLKLGIRGLELFADGVFEPDKEINRANFAMIIEDILVKLTREEYLPTKHMQCESPFKDVESSHYAFNAIVTCTTRGIMDADLEGYFGKEQPVTGADALLILRRLREKIK
ncbi:MAG: S-layer homology domain-containing protein [Pseudomonadota bacterium]